LRFPRSADESFVTKAIRAILRVYKGFINKKKVYIFIYMLPEMSETQRAQDEYNNNNNLCINA